MGSGDAAFASGNLPRTIPIFPLTGVLLLPRGRLPLNIFEPRYLNMTSDALGRGRIIGMVQPVVPRNDLMSPSGAEDETDEPAVYTTGCAGRIVSFAETGDGRFLITLEGVNRFRVAEEVDMRRGYRRVRTDYAPFRWDREADTDAVVNRERLLATLGEFAGAKRIEADWSQIKAASDVALVTTLSMLCPFEPGEKQALLECPGSGERADLLIALMQLAGHPFDATGAQARH